MTDGRPSAEATRRALIEAATNVFAERGYRGGSVRLITRLAGANQAAITYHFEGKDGLYRAVLREAVAAFEKHSFLDEHDIMTLDPVEAMRLTMHQFLLPLTQPGRLGKYIQIVGWEGIHPSPVYLAFLSEETPRLFKAVEQLVTRFLPAEAPPQEAALVVYWLLQQPISFVRNAQRLRLPPYELGLDEKAVARLADMLTVLSLHGLSQGPAALWPEPGRSES